jgi:sugar transferase (PEP-CTERM/EpsH1 system associated)
VRAYHVARHLASRYHLTLACLADERDVEGPLAALRQEIPDTVCIPMARGSNRRRAFGALLGTGRSATVAYFDSPELRTQLETRRRQTAFDLVYVSSSSMAQYLNGAERARVLVDFVDVDSDKWRQYGATLPCHKAWVYRLEARRLRNYEVEASRRADRCLVATDREEELLRGLAPWAPTSVIPNGVDLEYFRPSPEPAVESTIVFTGAMDYFPNTDAVEYFARWVFPRILRDVPTAQFVIVGKNPTANVRRLESIRGVRVTGTVPDVRPYLRRAAVAVAPLRIARGVQNKVLEAMAMGVPVVATAKAYEGLSAKVAEHLFVEDDPPALAEAVVHLLQTPSRRAAVGMAARRFVEAHYSWSTSLARLDEVVDAVTRHDSRNPSVGIS